MALIIIISIILLSILFICKAIKDIIQFDYDNSIFNNQTGFNCRWWNPELSWINKYQRGDRTFTKEKFLGSTTIFVFVTDAWHFFGFIQHNCIISIFILLVSVSLNLDWYYWIAIYLGLYITGTSVFNLFYEIILKRKQR